MATSLRGGAGSGKEKRGTSPSTSILKKSPKPSSSAPNGEEKSSSSTADSNKPVPNYLKPTISSSLDSSRNPRKPSSDTSAPKPVLNRRRSFERPPPSSQVQRAIRGPPSGTRDIKPLRSTSFSNKSPASSSSSKPTSEKLFARTSSLKDGKVDPQLSKSRSMKRSTLSSINTNTTRKEPTSSSSSSNAKKAPKSVTSESSVDHENRQSVDHLVIEDEFVNIDDDEVQSLPEMSEMPESNKELADPTNFPEVEETVQHFAQETSPKQDDDHHHEDDSTVAVPDQVEEETENIDHQTVEELEAADDQPQVEAAEEQNLVQDAGDQEDESDKKVPELVEPTETMVEETKEEEAEKGEEETEAKDEKQTVSSPPADAAAAAPAKTQNSAGKKDKQVYNDVIEETATKLMGKKNKVLALAGAFETVISLQDTNKS